LSWLRSAARARRAKSGEEVAKKRKENHDILIRLNFCGGLDSGAIAVIAGRMMAEKGREFRS